MLLSRRSSLLATLTALAVGLTLWAPAPAQAATPAVIVTEIVANNVGPDNLEYVEVHNTTEAPVTLGEGGLSLSYSYVDSADTSRDVPLALAEPLTLAPGATAVLWLSYATADGSVDSFARTIEDFRGYHGIDAAVPVVRLTGQPGMANGGDRGIRVLDGATVLSWSHYPVGSVGEDLAAHFQVAADGAATTLLSGPAARTPGVVDPAQLTPPGAEPEPEPGDPDPVRDPDPDLVTAPLQITEVMPDTANVGSADGYEFIEIYNATTEPISLADYQLVYLYPQDEQVNTNEAVWPLHPADAVVQPGATVVVWVKNAQNDALGAADFNSHFGSDLTLGVDLIETSSAGMANGSARGLALRTQTGFAVNRAYYNMAGADDVAADLGIRYAVAADLQVQTLLGGGAAPTPGRVQADQVPAGLMIPAADTTPPTVTDRTPSEIDPSADFVIDASIVDDVQVRRVTLELRNDVDGTVRTVNLTRDPQDENSYRYPVVAADLIGKDWYAYRLLVSDGTHTVTTDEVQVPVAGRSDAAVRLSVADGDLLSGTVDVSAAGEHYPAQLELAIDGATVSTVASLESAPVFVFDESQTDFYFRNGVRVGEDILYVFDEGSYAETRTRTVPVPLGYVQPGQPLVVSIWAGTKAGPWIDPDENNDDFVVSGMRLVLPDGRTLTPAGYDDPTQILQMGDSAGKYEFYDAAFTIPEDAYTGRSHTWDTTAVADGEHVVSAVDGEDWAQARVIVDNTPPTITPSITDGQTYQGQIVLDAEIVDATSGVADVTATLDGAAIELGQLTSSVELAAGEHVLQVVATDLAGNTTTSTTAFRTPQEFPFAGDFSPADGTVVEPGDLTLAARVQDPTGDALEVGFYEGHRFDLDDAEITASSGSVADAAALDRDGAAGAAPVSSTDQLPYQRFEVAVPDDAGADARVRLTWQGQANPGADVILYALAADGASWVEVDRTTAADGATAITLSGTVAVTDHAHQGVVTALVQHSEGYASPDQSDRTTQVVGGHPEDVPRSEYDFTIGWESDTQYYNEQYYDHQVAIHDYLLERREDLNLSYVIHTGDIVDDWDQPYQWENASPQYARFDDAGLPYGVLAGNHDVGSLASDYSVFEQYFGADRYAGNPWYGGSFQNNRGHYDLISAGGIDFLMLYMGWDPGDDAIAWMNDVLAQYPNRVAIINLHEYMLTTGGLGPIPQRILDEVVATNPNVRMVFSGHYHDAFTRVDTFDDDGDGVDDRSVYAMLFDYQGLPEGGLGYLRLLHFDNEGEKLMVRTYSPSLQDYNSDEPGLLGPEDDPYAYQEFDVPYAELGIVPQVRTLSSGGFEAEVLTENLIGSPAATAATDDGVAAFRLLAAAVPSVASGSVVSTLWSLTEAGEHGWYVRTADAYGAVSDSVVNRVVVDDGTGPGGGDGGGDGSGGDGSGGGGSGGVGSSEGGTDEAGRPDRPGTMPATGAGVLALLIVAGAALAAGLLLRLLGRRSARRHP